MADTITHKTHDRIPKGFTLANDLQEAEYAEAGSINGASKIAFVRSISTGLDITLIALRLHPPRSVYDIQSNLGYTAALAHSLDPAEALDYYIREYNNGFSAGSRGGDSKLWDSGLSNYAWDDGFLDGAAGRAKWHLTYCVDHDACGEG